MPSTMDPVTETHSASRSRRAEQSDRQNSNPSSQSIPPSYGYHNIFHTHATPVLASPPSYENANSAKALTWAYNKHLEEAAELWNNTSPPPYECTVFQSGVMGMKQELTAIFQVSRPRDWHHVYVVLEGTQLNIYRTKSPSLLSKNKSPSPGRLIRSFTLQHSEVGVASDFKKAPPAPKSPFAHLVPASARHKLYETDPHLFEPVREHVIRLRLETEQFLLCASSQEEMLDWTEKLCAAIDISQPLEDRSEPRYRSLPRRSRRQRVLDGSRLGENLENLYSLEAGRRIIAEQEEIIRQLYPHLAAGTSAPQLPELDLPSAPADVDGEEFDADDVRFPSQRLGSASLSRSVSNEEVRPTTRDMYPDPKDAPVVRPSQSQALRYRRRCAPALLACSPRVSDVVMCGGERARINAKANVLVMYTSHPPRYDAHDFPKAKRAAKVPKSVPGPILVARPSSPLRGVSDASVESFGYDLSSTSSDSAAEETRAGAPSEPPSPTALSQAKADAARQLVAMGKHRRSGDEVREHSMGAMALGVAGLLV